MIRTFVFLPEPSASAPPTISMISVVIESWRARFMVMLRFLISSSALSVADFIARWRKACSDAAALSSAAYSRAST
jgi:hypothetical protein